MPGGTIVVAGEDEVALCSLATALGGGGQEVRTVRTHELAHAHGRPAAVVVLRLPAADVPVVLGRLRDGGYRLGVDPCLPVVTIGGADEVDAIRAYAAGSDYHLPDTASDELVREAVEAVRQRCMPECRKPREPLVIGGLEFDTMGRTVRINGQLVQLTRLEFQLLTFFAAQPGRTFTREQLLREIWRSEAVAQNHNVSVRVTRLRAKLRVTGEDFIATVRRVGYRFTGGG